MSRKDQVLVSLFIVAYFFMVVVDIMAYCPFRTCALNFTRNVDLLLGIEQCWRMFCPDPRNFIFHPYAIITFADGSMAYYEFPRMEKMTQFDAFLRERLRKHFYDNMPWDDYSVFRPSIGRYIARCFADPSNPPTQVSLCYNGHLIPPLPSKIVLRNHLPPTTDRKVFFVYQVGAEDLK